MEKILNQRKIREVVKYLVQQKGFIAENSTWKKRKDLENIKEAVIEFGERFSIEVKGYKKLAMVEKKNLRREELPEKYIAKI